MSLRYPASANGENPSLIRVVYARGSTGFCLTRHAIAEMAQLGLNEAKALLAETGELSAFPHDLTNAYLYPVNPSYRSGAAKYFWENRSNPLMIQAIMELGSAAGPATSRLDVELIRLLPGESYAVQFENPSLNHQEYLELITDGTIQTRYSNCSLIPVAYAPGIVGFSVSRKAVELMAARGSRHARQLLTATELECRWGTANSDDKYYYPINAISHDGAAEYFWKNRSDQYLIDVISELGHEAGHPQAKLRVQHIRVLPNETYQVEYACPVGYGYYDDEQITINAKPKPKAEPKVQIKATLTATIQV